MYQALYRKWRPQTFDEVIGQKHVTDTLRNQIKTNRLSHAYIFIGTRGTGKTTCARILAKAVNCENPIDGNPCGSCASCRGIADGTIMDIVELDAASNNGVENVRMLRDEAVFSPTSVKKRVYIIDEVHMLSVAAFNALLKILEEPPEHLLFILATTELKKVPATILSRCQRHNFKRIDTPEIANYLMKIARDEQINLQMDAAELVARLAEGGVRDALSLLDQCSAFATIDRDAVYSAMGLAGTQKTVDMLQSILRHDTTEAITAFTEMWVDGKDPSSVLDELRSLLRDILMLHVAPAAAPKLLSGACELKVLQSFAAAMSNEEILSAIRTIQNAQDSMKGAKSPKTAAEICIVSLSDNLLGDSIADLRARIARLEAKLADPAFLAQAGHSDDRVQAGNAAVYSTARPVPRNEEYRAVTPAYAVNEAAATYNDRVSEEKPLTSRQEELQRETGMRYSLPDEEANEVQASVIPEPLPSDRKEEAVPVNRQDSDMLARMINAMQGAMLPALRPNFNNGVASRLVQRDNALVLYAVKGFYFDRFKKLENDLRSAIVRETGQNISFKVEIMTEEQSKPKELKNLKELGAFPEVTFIQ